MTGTLLAASLSPLAARYFRELPGAGVLPAGATAHTGEAGSAAAGTHVRFHLQAAAGVVTAARFQAYGCPHTLAVCAWLTEGLVGRAAAPGGPHEWAQVLSVPIEKLSRLLTVEDALNAALSSALSE
ncbi:MAG TPA: iron-sulfur cluster assembly scaffold protein [Steroidobacteraceae bacterium]|nr:iron-sulfur cluster assembly scaffold protein [Steroidobacteraceae bacterium]HRX90135.1 iron-sulfur cluster assembly scaffold protein [Steroidobacteraceae bacterium]